MMVQHSVVGPRPDWRSPPARQADVDQKRLAELAEALTQAEQAIRRIDAVLAAQRGERGAGTEHRASTAADERPGDWRPGRIEYYSGGRILAIR
jgi:hypothetical protein